MIRRAAAKDHDAIWQVLEPVIREGETYALDRDLSREAALDYWLAPSNRCYVAEIDGAVLGTYILRANQGGGGKHVCNCGYIVSPAARGAGLARAMCEHSMDEARRLEFRAMQFNFVVSTNTGAVHLWEKLDFEIVGRLPGAFESPSTGLVDAFVMFRAL